METYYLTVVYWTDKDDREGSCGPCGNIDVTVKANSHSQAEAILESQKRFKRSDGSSRIYDISEK